MKYYINKLTLKLTREPIPAGFDDQITSSSVTEKILRQIWDEDILIRERFYVLLLNQRNNIIGYENISVGGVSSTTVDSKLIFSLAIKTLSSSVILAHNHPSGSTKPSEADIRLTKQVAKAAELLDMRVLDHVILTGSANYYSFADNGLIS